jgi:hypothetical protein
MLPLLEDFVRMKCARVDWARFPAMRTHMHEEEKALVLLVVELHESRT